MPEPRSDCESAVHRVAPIARPAAVLVVDDDSEIRDVVRAFLEQEGYATVAASDGEEALELLRDRSIRIGLVLLDLLMPTMDGWEFQARWREEPSLAAIPVVIVTAQSRVLAGLSEKKPHDSIIPKPIDFDRLLEVVARHCA